MNITKIAVGQRITFEETELAERYGLTGYVEKHFGKYCMGTVCSTKERYKDSLKDTLNIYEDSKHNEPENYNLISSDKMEKIRVKIMPKLVEHDSCFEGSIEKLKETLKELKVTGFFSEHDYYGKEDHSYLSLKDATIIPHMRYRMDPVGVNEMQEFLGFSVRGDNFDDGHVITVHMLLDLKKKSDDEAVLISSKDETDTYRFGLYRNKDIAAEKNKEDDFNYL